MAKNARSALSFAHEKRDMVLGRIVVIGLLLTWGCESDTTAPRSLEPERTQVSTITTLRPRLDRPGVDTVGGSSDWRHMEDPDRGQIIQIGEVDPDPIKPLYPLVRDEDISTFIKSFEIFGIWNTSFLLDPYPIGKSVTNVRVVALNVNVPGATGYKTYLVIGGTRYDVASGTGSLITDLTVNPATGGAFRGSDFASMQLGIWASGWLSDITVAQMVCVELYIEVTHNQHPGPSVVLIRDLPPAIR